MTLADFLLLTPCEGSGITGTKATGLITLRPDFVRVVSGVYESDSSELSSSYGGLASSFTPAQLSLQLTSSSLSLSALFRLPPLPPRPPRPRPRSLPDPRPDPAGEGPGAILGKVGVATLPTLPRFPVLAIGGGVGNLSLVI